MLNRNVYSLVVRFSGRKEMVRAAAKKNIIDDARMGFGMLEQQNLQDSIFILFPQLFLCVFISKFKGCLHSKLMKIFH